MNTVALRNDDLTQPDNKAVSVGSLSRRKINKNPDLSARQRAFLAVTVLRQAHGIEAPYLYTSGNDWDDHVEDAEYGFMNSDAQVIQSSLQNGLLDYFGSINCIEELGVGTNSSTVLKTDPVLTAVEEAYGPDALATIAGYDGVKRYVKTYRNHVFNKYENLGVAGGAVADFMRDIDLDQSDPDYTNDVRNAVNEGARRVTMVWGGTLENGPDIIGGPNPEHHLISYMAKINQRNGVGATLLRTVDIEQDMDVLADSYKMTDAFADFTLSPLYAAAGEDKTIILPNNVSPKDYIKGHWVADTEIKRVEEGWTQARLLRVCNKSHKMYTVSTPDGIGMEEGVVRSSSLLSNKFSLEKQIRAAHLAGYGRIRVFDAAGGVYSEDDIKAGAQVSGSKVLIACESTRLPRTEALNCKMPNPL